MIVGAFNKLFRNAAAFKGKNVFEKVISTYKYLIIITLEINKSILLWRYERTQRETCGL